MILMEINLKICFKIDIFDQFCTSKKAGRKVLEKRDCPVQKYAVVQSFKAKSNFFGGTP